MIFQPNFEGLSGSEIGAPNKACQPEFGFLLTITHRLKPRMATDFSFMVW